jgi:hypothetical protein
LKRPEPAVRAAARVMAQSGSNEVRIVSGLAASFFHFAVIC